MKTDIILAGVGGQGILSIAAILGAAALNENLYLKQAETHGMSQRGGQWFRTCGFPIHRFIPIYSAGRADIILRLNHWNRCGITLSFKKRKIGDQYNRV